MLQVDEARVDQRRQRAQRLDVGVGEGRVVVGRVGEAQRPPEPLGALRRDAGQLGDLQPGVPARPVEQQPVQRVPGVGPVGPGRPCAGGSPFCVRRRQPVVCTIEHVDVRAAGGVGRHRAQQARPLMPVSPRLPTTSRSADSRRTTSSSASTGEPTPATVRTRRAVRPRPAAVPGALVRGAPDDLGGPRPVSTGGLMDRGPSYGLGLDTSRCAAPRGRQPVGR